MPHLTSLIACVAHRHTGVAEGVPGLPMEEAGEASFAQAILQQWGEVKGRAARTFAQTAQTRPLEDHSEFHENVKAVILAFRDVCSYLHRGRWKKTRRWRRQWMLAATCGTWEGKRTSWRQWWQRSLIDGMAKSLRRPWKGSADFVALSADAL